MKILIITTGVDPKSGWGRYSRGIVEGLLAEGIEVALFSQQKPDLPVAWQKLLPLGSAFAPFLFLKNSFAVRKAAKRADVVHALDGWPFGVYGYFAVLGTRKKLFINGVGTYTVAPLYSQGKGALLRRAYLCAEKIFCISKYVQEQLEAAAPLGNKLMTVHMGTAGLPVPSQADIDSYRIELGIAPGQYPIVLTVGAIKDRKGQQETLAAVQLLQKKYPSIVYIAAGSGNQSGYVAEMKARANAGAKLLVVENVDDYKLAMLYSLCTVFALNSNTDTKHHHFEGFGLAIIEACQFGKPAVGSRDSGIEDAINDGSTGLLTAQRDPKDIADKIGKILDNYELFSNNAKMHYADFSWAKAVKTYIDFYNR